MARQFLRAGSFTMSTAVPCRCSSPGGVPYRLARISLDELSAAGLDERGACDDVKQLAQAVRVSGNAGARDEAHHVRPPNSTSSVRRASFDAISPSIRWAALGVVSSSPRAVSAGKPRRRREQRGRRDAPGNANSGGAVKGGGMVNKPGAGATRSGSERTGAGKVGSGKAAAARVGSGKAGGKVAWSSGSLPSGSGGASKASQNFRGRAR